jgi:hypothetical protein
MGKGSGTRECRFRVRGKVESGRDTVAKDHDGLLTWNDASRGPMRLERRASIGFLRDSPELHGCMFIRDIQDSCTAGEACAGSVDSRPVTDAFLDS